MRFSSDSGPGKERGFTLLEIMVVLAIIVGLAILAASAVRGLRHSELRDQADQLSRDMRYAFDKSMETGDCFRLVIDLDKQTYTLEETDQRFYAPRGNDEQSVERAKQRQELLHSNAGVNQMLASQAQAAGVDPNLFLPPAEPETQFNAFKDTQVKPVTLPAGVRITDVLTGRDIDKVTTGKAYIYFYPEGFVERAALHLTDRGGSVYTLVTQPVRGAVKIDDSDVEYVPGDMVPTTGGQNGMEKAL